MKFFFHIAFVFLNTSVIAQTIDWNTFSEEHMNQSMFSEMNKYVKRTHGGDSLILSEVVQENIMPRNYNLIRNQKHQALRSLHNQEWINEDVNALPDSLMNKIIEENANPKLLESIYLEDFNVYVKLSYMEILQSSSYPNNNLISYQEVAKEFIKNWNNSPPHAGYMNANYRSKVIVGVTTYYHKVSRTIFISFVYVS